MPSEHEIEPDERGSLEIRRDNIAYSIAFELASGTITTDNVSRENGLSGLDSVCIYFAHALSLSPEEFRTLVLNHYKMYGQYFSMDDTPLEEECDEEEIDYSTTHDVENDDKATVKAIAMMIRMGLVADDVKSLLNERTPLEQLISYLFWAFDDEEIGEYKLEILGALSDFAGGYYLRSGNFGIDYKLILGDKSSNSI